jgi:hypothetical protein
LPPFITVAALTASGGLRSGARAPVGTGRDCTSARGCANDARRHRKDIENSLEILTGGSIARMELRRSDGVNFHILKFFLFIA